MKTVVELRVSADRVAVGVPSAAGDEMRWLAERDHGEARTVEEAAEVLLTRPELRYVRRVRVCLEPPLVQLRTLPGLPPVSEAELRLLVAQAVRRFFRSDGRPLTTTARWQSNEGDERVARAAAAPTELVRTLETVVEETGHVLERLGPVPSAGPPLDLSTPIQETRRRRRTIRAVVPLVALALAAWSVAAGRYAWDLVRDRDALAREAEAAALHVRQIEAIRARVAEFRAVAHAVEGATGDDAWARTLLGRITEALPDGCHLQGLSLANRDAPARVEASCPDPLEMVRSLEEHGLGGVTLEGPPSLPSQTASGPIPFSLSVEGPT